MLDRDREPRRGLAAERAALRAHGDDGDHRRAHRPRQPPHLPGAVRRDAGARRAHRRQGTRCCSPTSITSRRSTTPTATRSATWCSAASRRSCSDCVRKIDLAARYGGEEFAIVLEAPTSPARACSPSASAPRCRSRSSSHRRGRSRSRSRSASPSIPTTARRARPSSSTPTSRSITPSTAAGTAPSPGPISSPGRVTQSRQVAS